MIVKLYKCSDDINIFNKTYTNEIAVDCISYDVQSVITPHIKLIYNNNLLSYNYVVMLNRYYKIVDFTLNNDNSITLHLSIDVLATYKNQLLNCNCVVIRTGDKPTDISDDKLPIHPYLKIFESQVIQNNLSAPTYILQVKGAE